MNARTIARHVGRHAIWYVLGAAAVLVLGTVVAGSVSGADAGAGTGEPERGWGGMLGIIAAAAAAYGIHRAAQAIREKINNPSPRAGIGPGVSDSSQVSAVSLSPVTRDTRRQKRRFVETTTPGTYRRVDAVDAGRDDAVDLDLDDGTEADETLEEYVARAMAAGARSSEIVAQATAAYGVSERTVTRRIANVLSARSAA